MRRPASHTSNSRQRGVALMVMLVVMIMGIAAVLIGSLSTTALKIEQQKRTAEALALAKDALIGYAVTYGDTHANQVHGYLPCPDIDASNGEGSSKLSCNGKDVSTIGRLPWRTLGLGTLRGDSSECLWYAVSGTYKYNTKTDLMNWDTPGLLEILDAAGNVIARDVVAIVFAPGAALGSQNHAPNGTAPICGGNYAAANYLDSDGTLNNGTVSATANATSQFRLASSTQINDQLIYITRQDIWNAMLKRKDFMSTLSTMTQKAAECIADYGRRNRDSSNNINLDDKRIPWSGRLRSPIDDYQTDSNYDDEVGRMAGRLPYRVNTSDSYTNNQINSLYYQLQLQSAVPHTPINCPNVPEWTSYYPWWTNWKDHVYYALANNFKPSSGSTSCGTCLSVNGMGNYAAVVMFAGSALPGQTRTTTSDRLNLANYLEGRNYSNGSNSSGASNYESAGAGSFNDVLYCINADLTVTPC